MVRRGTEPGCHRNRGGCLLQPAACTYDRADLDSGADLDSYSRTYLDSCAYMDTGSDLHAYTVADVNTAAAADSYRDSHVYCDGDRYANADRDANARSITYPVAYRNAHRDS